MKKLTIESNYIDKQVKQAHTDSQYLYIYEGGIPPMKITGDYKF